MGNTRKGGTVNLRGGMKNHNFIYCLKKVSMVGIISGREILGVGKRRVNGQTYMTPPSKKLSELRPFS